ncbi:ankyrin repeat domain-containing protein [Undibacterium sp. CY21W]|uniref:ankyrin repeat domain-containing protein n=1 Tax=Undibacterium sp. CY21W TaxID=2762293 RepID=UPI00164A7C14|nr:ankyrin repeat domain-containing protein [Undibacterium sp. CY21W]MBC3928458.1 ankyrin repeat domain-containing protein [Undibacterium sp. CY21W]
MRLTPAALLLALACLMPVAANADAYADFVFAVKFNDAPAVQEFLQRGMDVNSVEEYRGESMLMTALRNKSMRVVDVLLQVPDLNINARAKNGDTALMVASFLGNADAVRKIIARGAEVNQPGWTALHYAAANGSVEAIALLLEHHAYIDTESPNKTTPLMMATRFGKLDAARLLIGEGADLTLKNDLGMTALDFAKESQHGDLTELLQQSLVAQKK